MKMNKLNFDTYLNESLHTLDKEITPQKDLWTGIEKAIVNTHHPVQARVSLWPKLSVMAGFAVMALLMAQLFVVTPKQQQITRMSEQFAQQKQQLLVQYKDKSALTDNWQVQLQELEEAEQAIKQALKSQPQNQALFSMLAQVYKQQLDLINKVHAPRWQHI